VGALRGAIPSALNVGADEKALNKKTKRGL